MEQIIRQPDGKLAVFSSITDTFIVVDATREEIIAWRVERVAEKVRQRTEEELRLVLDSGESRPYYQFTLTWEEASRKNREHGGDLTP
jgi:hypothetical protein